MAQTYEDKLTLEAWNGKLTRELLAEYIVTEEAQTVSIDATAIDWNRWQIVAIHASPAVVHNAIVNFKALDENGQGYNRYKAPSSTSISNEGFGMASTDQDMAAYLFSWKNAANQVRAVTFGYDFGTTGYCTLTFAQTQRLEVTVKDARYPWAVGSVIRVYGVE